MAPRNYEPYFNEDINMMHSWIEERITLKIYRGIGDIFVTKYGMHTPLSSLFSLYCLSQNINPATFMFSFRGKIEPWQTPKQVGMYDDCTITAYCGDAVNLVIRCPDGDAHYITGRTLPLGKLFDAFQSKYSELQTLKFQIGDKIVEDWSSTPQTYGLKDGDVIRALVSNAPDSIIMISMELNGSQTCCRIKRSTKLGLLFEAFCQRLKLQRCQVKFFFRSTELYEDNSPVDADIQDNDVITVQTFFMKVNTLALT